MDGTLSQILTELFDVTRQRDELARQTAALQKLVDQLRDDAQDEEQKS